MHRVVTASIVLACAGLIAAGSWAAKKERAPKTTLTILYQGNVNGEIEPCG